VNIRLYLDEDTMSTALVNALRSAGIEVITALEAGMITRPDEEHLGYAAEHGLVLHSFNVKDYQQLNSRFIRQGLSHAGIILAQKNRYSVGEHTRRMVILINGISAEEMRGQVVFLSGWQ
jgi:hypothetical protein